MAKHAWANHYSPSTIANVVWLYENQTEVKLWRATWSNRQHRQLITPRRIKQRYEDTLSDVEVRDAKLKHKAAQPQAKRSMFVLARNSAQAIANVIYSNVSESKAAAIHAALGELIKGGDARTTSENLGS